MKSNGMKDRLALSVVVLGVSLFTFYLLYTWPDKRGTASQDNHGPGPTGPVVSRKVTHKDYNIVLISVDALNYSHLGCYGYPRNTSPNIDAFSERCFRFEQAVSPAGWTVPSYASLFSGQYPLTHQVVLTDSKIPESATLLTELLLDRGYSTAIFSELGFLTPEFGIGQGFERFDFSKERYDPQRYDRAVSWLREHQKEKFFLFFYTNDVHGPYQPPEPFSSIFVDDEFYHDTKQVTARPEDYTRGRIREESTEGIPREIYVEGVTSVAYYVARYDGAIRYTDHQMKKLFDALEANRLLENTIVLFTADHGESMGEHERYFAHSSFFDDIIRVPFLMYVPSTRPRVIEEQIQLVDVAPTLLNLLGMPEHQDMDGLSFLDLLMGGKATVREYSYAVGACWGMIRSKDHKLVIGIAGSNPQRVLARNYLFDLRKDPGELNNLYEENETVRSVLEQEYHRWHRRHIAYAQAREQTEIKGDKLENLKALGYLR